MVAIYRILHTFPIVVGMAALPAGAQGIFKCVDGEATAYLSAPCASGQVQLRLAIAQPTSAEIESVSAAPRAEDRRLKFVNATLVDIVDKPAPEMVASVATSLRQ